MTAVIESVDTCPEAELRALAEGLAETCEEYAVYLKECLKQKIVTIRWVVRGILKDLRKAPVPSKAFPIYDTWEERTDHALAVGHSHLSAVPEEQWIKMAAHAGMPVEGFRRKMWQMMVTSIWHWD